MPYTFGGAVSDRITWTHSMGVGDTATSWLVCGWWYPTTLTATRGLWSFGNNMGAEIDIVTAELRLKTDNTTDGQWTTSGVSLSTNSWKFIAAFGSCLNSGSTAAWRVWAGTSNSPPVACTVTSAVPSSGNFTGSASFYLGNKGNGSVPFQGSIAHVSLFTTGNTAGVLHPFNQSAYGAISDAEALFVYERYVLPCWYGHPFMVALLSCTSYLHMAHYSLDAGAQVVRHCRNSNLAFSGIFPTIAGATPDVLAAPRAFSSNILHPKRLH